MSHHDPSLALNTLVLAKTYGVYFVVVGLALIFSPERFRKWYEDILQEPRRVLFGGTISLIIGSYILAVHNHFVSDWPIVLTAIGYWGVLSGAGCLISGKFISLFKKLSNELSF